MEVRVILEDGDVITTAGSDEFMRDFIQDVRVWLGPLDEGLPDFVKVGEVIYVPPSTIKMVVLDLDKE